MIVYTSRDIARELHISQSAAMNRVRKAGLTLPLSMEELELIRNWRGPGNLSRAKPE